MTGSVITLGLYLKVTVPLGKWVPVPLDLKPNCHYPLNTMAGITIEELLKGHTIRPNATAPDAKPQGWRLDSYKQLFPHKAYAAIMAVAIAQGMGKISFQDIKAYALRIVTADGSEAYFTGERGFSTIEQEKFSEEVSSIKARLEKVHLPAAKLEAVLGFELKEVEKVGGLQLRILAMDINDIAKATMNYMKPRKEIPYLKPVKDPNSPRAIFYEIIKAR